MSYDTHAELLVTNIAFERNYQWLFSNINTTLNAGETLLVQGALEKYNKITNNNCII
jgi:hypothetical protein